MHVSNVAHKLKCRHCGEFQGTDKWPINGDQNTFYYKKEPGNYSLKINCSHCKDDFYIVWNYDPGQIKSLSFVRERKSIHYPDAIKRNIKFKQSGKASDACCWNCSNFNIVHGGKYWCSEYMIEVDRSDLCSFWQQRTIYRTKRWWQIWR